MPKIYNSDLADVNNGKCKLYGDNCILISINDPCCEAKPKQDFKAIYHFEFLDIEDSEHDFAIMVKQAREIAIILQHCYERNIDVVVHCMAGVSRSRAVAEVGEMIGFDYVGSYREPNVLVKTLLMDQFIFNHEEETN